LASCCLGLVQSFWCRWWPVDKDGCEIAPDVCVRSRGVLEGRGSKRGCESLPICRQCSTMHANPNASFRGGTRQAPQDAVFPTRGVQLLMVPLRISCARCHLLGPALRHAAVASLLCGCCISTRPLLLQCLQALRSSSFKTRPAPSALGDLLVASYSLFSQCLGPASRFSLTAATGPLRHTTRVDTIPCQGTGQPLFVLIPRSRVRYLCSKGPRCHSIIHNVW
jgi:hypothetical protein